MMFADAVRESQISGEGQQPRENASGAATYLVIQFRITVCIIRRAVPQSARRSRRQAICPRRVYDL